MYAYSGKYWRHLSLFHNIFGIQEPSGGQNHSRKVSLRKAGWDFLLPVPLVISGIAWCYLFPLVTFLPVCLDGGLPFTDAFLFFSPRVALCTFPYNSSCHTLILLESMLPAIFSLRGTSRKSGQFPHGRCGLTAAASAAASVVWNSNPWLVFRACRWISWWRLSISKLCSVLH